MTIDLETAIHVTTDLLQNYGGDKDQGEFEALRLVIQAAGRSLSMTNCEGCIEEELRKERHRRIGWAIMHMTYWQRLWWALTGRGKYMQRSFWE